MCWGRCHREVKRKRTNGGGTSGVPTHGGGTKNGTRRGRFLELQIKGGGGGLKKQRKARITFG